MNAIASTLSLDTGLVADPIVSTAARHVDPVIAERARAILNKRRARTKSIARTIDQQTRLCAIIASLPAKVKVQDVAKLYGLTPTHLSRLRGMAFRGTFPVPAGFQDAIADSFTPRASV